LKLSYGGEEFLKLSPTDQTKMGCILIYEINYINCYPVINMIILYINFVFISCLSLMINTPWADCSLRLSSPSSCYTSQNHVWNETLLRVLLWPPIPSFTHTLSKAVPNTKHYCTALIARSRKYVTKWTDHKNLCLLK